jgi:hypothetical protein
MKDKEIEKLVQKISYWNEYESSVLLKEEKIKEFISQLLEEYRRKGYEQALKDTNIIKANQDQADKSVEWEKELKQMLIDAGFKPIQFKMNNSGVRILSFLQTLLAETRKEVVEEIEKVYQEFEDNKPPFELNKYDNQYNIGLYEGQSKAMETVVRRLFNVNGDELKNLLNKTV